MDPLKMLQARRANYAADAEAILEAAKKESRNLTAEELSKIQDLSAKVEGLKAEEKALIEQDQREAEARAAVERMKTGSIGAPAPGSGAEARIEIGADRAALDPMRGFASPRAFFNAIIDATLNRHTQRGRAATDRLRPLQAAVGSDEQSTFDNAYGGFLVPAGMSPDMLKVAAEASVIGGAVTRIPMTATSIKFNARVDKDHSTSVSGGLTWSRRPESGSMTPSRMKFEQVEIRADSLYGLSYSTRELIQDSPESVAALLASGFQEQLGSHLDTERLYGTGVGEFMGIMNSPALISIAKESGQAADTIVYDNILKMFARVWQPDNAIWVASRTTFPQLAKMIVVAGVGGSAVWMPSAVPGAPMTLLGRPIYFTEKMKALGDKGDILLGNFSEFIEGTYQEGQQEESIHVRFDTHEIAFKFTVRNGGAPWWKSALTPEHGDTLSPFVTLNAR